MTTALATGGIGRRGDAARRSGRVDITELSLQPAR
jgi:hypothetical protein